jgi:acetyl esterase
MVSDALCALAWTKAKAGEYGLDPDRITVFGCSAGGGIAATLQQSLVVFANEALL